MEMITIVPVCFITLQQTHLLRCSTIIIIIVRLRLCAWQSSQNLMCYRMTRLMS